MSTPNTLKSSAFRWSVWLLLVVVFAAAASWAAWFFFFKERAQPQEAPVLLTPFPPDIPRKNGLTFSLPRGFFGRVIAAGEESQVFYLVTDKDYLYTIYASRDENGRIERPIITQNGLIPHKNERYIKTENSKINERAWHLILLPGGKIQSLLNPETPMPTFDFEQNADYLRVQSEFFQGDAVYTEPVILN